MAKNRRFPSEMLKRPTPLEQALSDAMGRSPDRRGERAVECCLEQNRAYSRHLAPLDGGAVSPFHDGPGT